MSPCCIYGCVAKTGIKQMKGSGSFYCEKHYPQEHNQGAANPANGRGEH
jgi:hypothetical protein